jgi:hypothetical protein
LLPVVFRSADAQEIYKWHLYSGYPTLFFYSLIQIAVAVWLFLEAGRKGRSCWVWSLLGLCFSLMAAVLYYVVPIEKKFRTKYTMES